MYSRPNVSKGNGDLIGIGQPWDKYLNFCAWRPKHLWLSKYRSMQLNLPFPSNKSGCNVHLFMPMYGESTLLSLYKPGMLCSSYMKVRKLSPWSTKAKCIVELLSPSWCHTYTVTNTPTSLHNKLPPAVQSSVSMAARVTVHILHVTWSNKSMYSNTALYTQIYSN